MGADWGTTAVPGGSPRGVSAPRPQAAQHPAGGTPWDSLAGPEREDRYNAQDLTGGDGHYKRTAEGSFPDTWFW